MDLRNLKVAIFCGSLVGGGAEVFTINLAKGLASTGLVVHLVVVKNDYTKTDEFPKNLELFDLKSESLLKSTPNFIKYLRAEKPTFVISVLDYVNVVAIWATYLSRVKAKNIATVHAQPSFFYKDLRTFKGKCLQYILSLSYHRAHKIIGVSAGLVQELRNNLKLPRQKFRVIYNPIINKKIFELSKETVSHHWAQTEEVEIILAVGRLSVEKDYPTLFKAFDLVQSNRNARLIVLGEGGERKNLQALALSLGLADKIEMLGFESNPYKYMSIASCFVLTSRSEGFANVLVEAMAIGTPIIATNCPHGPKEILGNGKWGKLVPVGDYISLSKGIDEILDESHPSSETNREAHLQKFKIDSIIQKYKDILLSD